MRRSALAASLSILFASCAVGADRGDAKVLAMLKSNTIVKAAVTEGMTFTGAADCSYKIKTGQSENFRPGTAFDYSAVITCDGGEADMEASAIIKVSGTLIEDLPNQLTLSIGFAE